ALLAVLGDVAAGHAGAVERLRVVAAGEREVAALGDRLLADQAPVDLDVRDPLRLLHGGDLVPVLGRGVGPARHQRDRHRLVDDRHDLWVAVVIGSLDLLGGVRAAAAAAAAGGQRRGGGQDGGGGENGATGERGGGHDVLSGACVGCGAGLWADGGSWGGAAARGRPRSRHQAEAAKGTPTPITGSSPGQPEASSASGQPTQIVISASDSTGRA